MDSVVKTACKVCWSILMDAYENIIFDNLSYIVNILQCLANIKSFRWSNWRLWIVFDSLNLIWWKSGQIIGFMSMGEKYRKYWKGESWSWSDFLFGNFRGSMYFLSFVVFDWTLQGENIFVTAHVVKDSMKIPKLLEYIVLIRSFKR